MRSDYWPVHAHSEFSWLDGMGSVEQMVQTVDKLGQPALALTDHGVMAGTLRLYKLCRKAGIEPFPGEEFYLVQSTEDDSKNRRYHVGLMALTQKGFEGLVKLSTLSHMQFYRKPLISFADLRAFGAEYGHDVALTTGCFFGLPIQMLVNEGPDECRGALRMFAGWFPNTFVELQHHGISDETHDDDVIVKQMHGFAQELGLPVVVGQDSHYCDAIYQPVHDMMKHVSYHGTDGDDFTFPGGPYHLATADEVSASFASNVWADIEDGHGALLDMGQLKIPELDGYRFCVPEYVKIPNDRLRSLAEAHLFNRGLKTPEYSERLAFELEVIKEQDFSNYFLIIQDICDWCRKQGITINARGSANGSLVCYVLGITNVDPLVWGTDFTRFMSRDRVKPPDIDIDIASKSRQRVLDYVRQLFPDMLHIGTYGRLGMREDPITGETKGSLYVQYKAAMRRKIDGYVDGVRPEDRQALDALGIMDVRRGPGMHASGVVLPSQALPVDRLLAKMWIASSKTFVTQAVMEDVEDAGYVKGDFLGVSMLGTIDSCLGLIGKPKGELDWIPWDDRKACALLRSGKTVGIFQFEGPSTSRGGREMKVANTGDAILAMALFRPAIMNGGQKDRYLMAREQKKAWPLPQHLEPILGPTMGVPIFQEQVIEIMRSVGMPPDELNDFLKAVKASNDKIDADAQTIIRTAGPRFKRYAVEGGFMTKQEASKAWKTVRDFSDYGFNKAHATAYGIMAYRTAYLKAHYPLEFMTATLDTWAGTPSERHYVQEARRLGFSIVKPDVNASEVSWGIDRARRKPSIRRGLITIGGVGAAAAEAIVEERRDNGPYSSLEDMIDRLPARPVTGGKDWAKSGELKGVYKALFDASAMREFDQQQGAS